MRGSLRSMVCAALVLTAVMSAPIILLAVDPASAETPTEVVAGLMDDGVFVAPTATQVDPSVVPALAAVVVSARSLGINLVIVAPADPQPDAESFSLRVLQAAEIDTSLLTDAVLLMSPDGELEASAADDYTDFVVPALDAARQAPSPQAASEAFVARLDHEPDRSLPATVRTVITVVVLMLAVLGLSVVLERMLRRQRRPNR
ncbi:MAG: hypothetical protein O3C27_08555 [Actinomycetota bacterium]|nr:hypothetical protein [Actinomycetota bacterium]